MRQPWDGSRPPAPNEFHPDNTRRGLLSAALTPVSVLVGALAACAVAVAVGEATEDLLRGEAPLGLQVTAAVIVLVVGLVAPGLAFVYSRWARRAGDPRAGRAQRAALAGAVLVVACAVAAGLLL